MNLTTNLIRQRNFFRLALEADQDDFKKFQAVHYLALTEDFPDKKLTRLANHQLLKVSINIEKGLSTFSPLYLNISNCYNEEGKV